MGYQSEYFTALDKPTCVKLYHLAVTSTVSQAANTGNVLH